MEGIFYNYLPGSRLSAFESGEVDSATAVIVVPGLTDGPMCLTYLNYLNQKLKNLGKISLFYALT